jgi:hypothetical protein
MGTTTFSGPVKAGTVKSGAGTNTGFAVMAQSAEVTEVNAFGTTSIIIPANSQIVDIKCLVTTAFDNGTNTIDVGISSDTDLYVDGMNCGTAGLVNMTAATTGTEAKWKNVGSSDVTIVFISPGAGNGAGVLTVEYIQNRSL